ncbi:hypothetical protein Gpo141_00012488 [Globisporangium polare]
MSAMNSSLPVSPSPSEPAAAHAANDCRQCDRCTRHEELLCRYAGKKCHNPRATKRNGSLHNLCNHHRTRANQNQRRMSHRIRIKQEHVQSVVAARTTVRSDETVTFCLDWMWPHEPWKYSTQAAGFTSGAAASQVNHYADDYPWPELAPIHHENFVWSDQELMAGLIGPDAVVNGSERVSVVWYRG